MPRPIEELSAAQCRRLRLIASDVDDTMTVGGRLTSRVLSLLERARESGLPLIVVTGRPAGIAMALATYLPGAEAAIGENGGVLAGADDCRALPGSETDVGGLPERLAACRRELEREAPEAKVSGDNFTRLTDLTYVVAGMSHRTRSAVDRAAARHGLVTSASSIHVHVKPSIYGKGRALLDWMAGRTPPLAADEVLTVGDSETDASLFDTSVFPVSVGVANVENVLGRLSTPPEYVTRGREGHGFAELLEWVLDRRLDPS